ncbi:alpha/beta fold hydrolase [Pseudonocardia sp. CA-107938]|uniref:alpha/beta fold hydrolase n=1 Tax=Pseudonocardia sp. CA-107938 TaxID=3240021 RepID=UPI003D8CC08F
MATATLPTGPTIAYTDTGGPGLPVVLAHGFMLDSDLFAAQVEALSSQFRVITWDARGHGGTTYDGRPFTEWDNVEDLVALMDALGIDRAVIGGHSQGGYISLAAALRHPGRVLGLVLINTTSHSQVASTADTGEREHLAARWEIEGPTDELCRALAHMAFGGDDVEPWIAKWKARPPDSVLVPFRAVLHRDDLTDRLSRITAPALVIHGTADASIALDEARDYAARIPNAGPVVAVDGAPHASCYTHPRPVNEAILEFLGGLPAQ